MVSQQHDAPGRPWLKVLTIGLVVLVSAAAVASYGLRTSIAAFGLTRVLAENGLSPTEVSVSHVGLRQTDIGPVVLGDGDLKLSSVTATYDLTSALFGGELQSITVNGLVLRGEWSTGGLTFGVLDHIGTIAEQNRPSGDNESSGNVLPVKRMTVVDMDVQVERVDGRLSGSGNVSLELTGQTAQAAIDAQFDGPGLEGSLVWTGYINQTDFFASSGAGSLTFNVDRFAVPGASPEQVVNGFGAINIAFTDRTFAVTVADAVELSAPWPAIATISSDTPTDQPVVLSIRTRTDSPTLLQVTETSEGLRGAAALAMDWVSPMGSGKADVNGWAQFSSGGVPQDFYFDRLDLELDGMPTPFGTLSASLETNDLAGPVTKAASPVTATLTLTDGRFQGLSYSDLAIQVDALLRFNGRSLGFDIQALESAAENVWFEDVARFVDPLVLTIVQDLPNTQSVTVGIGADGSTTFTFDVGVGLNEGALALVSGNAETVVEGRFPALSVEGTWGGQDSLNLNVESGGGTLESPFGKLTNVRTQIVSHGGSVNGTITADLTLDRMRAASRPGLPLNTTFTLIDGTVRSESKLSLGRDLTLSTVSANYDLTGQRGAIAATIGPLVFGGDDIGPSDIAPLALPMTVRSGEIFAEFAIPLGASEGLNEGAVLVRDLDLDLGDYRFDRVNAAISLDQAWPIKVMDNQNLAVGLLQAGVPLTDVRAVFSVQDPSGVDLSELRMDFAGGMIAAEAARLAFSGQSEMTFDVNGIDLTELANLSGLDGLSADGQLSGTLPVAISADDAIILNGKLEAHGPGTIRYSSAATSAASGDGESGYGLALRALEDFRYDALSVSVNGSLSQLLDVGLQIKGSNPAVYDGYPIDFNLNLSGELANVIRGSLTGYRVPETIRRQLMDFPTSQR